MYVFSGLIASALMALFRRASNSPCAIVGTSTKPDSSADPISRGRGVGQLALIASFAVLSGVAGLRYGPGTDYFARYVPLFAQVQAGADVDLEPGFRLLMRAVAAATDDYQWLFAVSTLLTLGLFYRFFLRMSVNPAMSVYIYVFGGTYLEAFNLVRQGIAIAILVNTIELVLRRKPVAFVLLTLAASTFHASALLWLLVWPALRLPAGRVVRVGAVFGLSAAILAAPQLGVLAVDRLAGSYSWYFSSNYGEVRSVDPLSILIPIALLVGTAIAFRSDIGRANYAGAVLALQGLQVAMLVATVSIAYVFSRATYYFTPIQALAVPLLLSSISDRRIRHFAVLLVLILYGAEFYYKFLVFNAHGVMPYRSIFSR